ncbi:PhzF family phenazine biosynthesis protein [Anoxynatronum buryatiense]|uniref:Phenazine biosynthesis protein PhzF family n=1 Tax=Anoxynatronum buryatiense TaxID=489973 RepID=A0AA45WXG0_9CLOT|nr:PhzF family phenazine biosynthesis isomerase [Anoxynatronum buryatiense]SMP64221.1 phenazine biosynthesis protein PhzF family [Anoxynatronum buryatiense]
MKKQKVLHYDAFSSVAHKGNPAGVVLNADHLNEDSMQSIAKAVGFNETVFVVKSDNADYRLRYFTPGHKINLCGHATIGSMYCMKSRGFIGEAVNEIKIETNVGVLPIRFETREDNLFVTMKQDEPQFMPFQGSMDALARSMGILSDEIDGTLPIVYGSTGAWTLLVHIKSLASFREMNPNNREFPDILKEKPRTSVHPFCILNDGDQVGMHARHFSSPYSGTVEDAVTGTASGAMGAYYLTYLNKEIDNIDFIVEQGQEINKDGKVYVSVKRNHHGMDVYVSGTGVFIQELDVTYE